MIHKNHLALAVLLLCVSCVPLEKAPASSTAGLDLPDECQNQSPGLSLEYRLLGYEQGSCNLSAKSPDNSILAYVRLEEKQRYDGLDLNGVDAVKIIHLDNPMPAEIYRSVRFRILSLKWLDDGRLLIWDAPADLEEGPGITAVYDPQAGGIVQRLPLPLDERVTTWNKQETAFYSAIFVSIRSACSVRMGGYDFTQDREMPSFQSIANQDQYVQVVGSPVWSEDGSRLLLSISSGTLIGNEPCMKIEWGPSDVMMLDLDGEELSPVLVKGDNEHNYYLQVDSDGQYEILSQPYTPFYSQCCRG